MATRTSRQQRQSGQSRQSAQSRQSGRGRRPSLTRQPRQTRQTGQAGSRRRMSPGISRIDQESTRTHGYFVRVGYERTKQGTWRPRYRAFFGDFSYGGKSKALRAAETWLREVREEYGE